MIHTLLIVIFFLFSFADANAEVIEANELKGKYDLFYAIGLSMQRGEFEKKDEYEKRIISSKKFIKGFSVYIPTDDSNFKYNTDKEEYAYSSYKTLNRDGVIEFAILHKEGSHNSYVGENIFGVKKNIQKKEVHSYNIRIINAKSTKKFWKNEVSFSLFFKCPLDIAKNIKKNIAVIAELTPACKTYDKYTWCTSTEEVRTKPTFEELVDITENRHNIHVYLENIVIKAKDTGDIIAQFRVR